MTSIPLGVPVRGFPGSTELFGSTELPEATVGSPAEPGTVTGGVVGKVGPVCATTVALAANITPAAKPRRLVQRIVRNLPCIPTPQQHQGFFVHCLFVSLFVRDLWIGFIRDML
jgi:hypothetical protein